MTHACGITSAIRFKLQTLQSVNHSMAVCFEMKKKHDRAQEIFVRQHNMYTRIFPQWIDLCHAIHVERKKSEQNGKDRNNSGVEATTTDRAKKKNCIRF